jgi:hypothetical protein
VKPCSVCRRVRCICLLGEATNVERNRELRALLPLEPDLDDLVECLLPLMPECERRDGSYLRAGMCVS